MKTSKKSAAKSSKKRAVKKTLPSAAIPAHPRYCSLRPMPTRTFGPEVGPRRAEIILISSNKWVNGTKLHYYFYKGTPDGSSDKWKGTKAQMDVVRNAFQTWKNQEIGLEFAEVDDVTDAEVRIAFLRGDGSWSYIGRDIIDGNVPDDEPTMNFGWDITNDADTVLHEIGHTLGYPHEHQNPFAGIVWNEEAVYASLAAPPNSWSRKKTFDNIIKKLNPNQVEGSSHDPDSIMHYQFEAGMIIEPPQFRNGLFPAGGLSARDVEFAKKFYPKLTAKDYTTLVAGKGQSMNIEPGDQRNFKFKPKRTRSHTIYTLGEMDTVMVLFEKSGNEEIQIAGDDDSGTGANAKIKMKLIKDREYIIRIRLFYRAANGETSIMIV
jgi:hypothetical protein